MDTFFLTRTNGQNFNLLDLDTWELLSPPCDDRINTWPNYTLQNIIKLYETTNEDQRQIIQFLIQFAYIQGVADAENSY